MYENGGEEIVRVVYVRHLNWGFWWGRFLGFVVVVLGGWMVSDIFNNVLRY